MTTLPKQSQMASNEQSNSQQDVSKPAGWINYFSPNLQIKLKVKDAGSFNTEKLWQAQWVNVL